jgi:hypothetical protein
MSGPFSKPVRSDAWERFASWWATENTSTSMEYLAARRAFLAAISIKGRLDWLGDGRPTDETLGAIMRGEIKDRP